ncbi:hypothetical protein M885DRAFT_532706 [Pelagophyceae sp. CCMP2097]|nr:hypothetical protein M885DRAFT_532706 [Pelagophyceae sp. CCMP2097]
MSDDDLRRAMAESTASHAKELAERKTWRTRRRSEETDGDSSDDELNRAELHRAIAASEKEAARRASFAADSADDSAGGPCLTLQEFVECFLVVEAEWRCKLAEIENGQLVRKGNNSLSRAEKDLAQTNSAFVPDKIQYGRILWNATQQIAVLAGLTRDEIFVDVGHGIGNAPIQLSFTIGCEARGIELSLGRCHVAKQLLLGIEEAVSLRPAQPRRRACELRNGNFCDPKHTDFIAGADVAFVNNFNGVMSERSSTAEGSLEPYLAALFSRMRPGARMLTLELLPSLGQPLAAANAARRDRGLAESPNASFFEHREATVKPAAVPWALDDGLTREPVVSWSPNGDEVVVHIYTRTAQTLEHACFLCASKGCNFAHDATATAVLGDDGRLVTNCVCCGAQRTGRQPRKAAAKRPRGSERGGD